MKKPVLFLTKSNRLLSADGDKADSDVMFSHLVGGETSVWESNLPNLKALAKLHGWGVSVRKTRQNEMDEGDC